MKTIQLFFLIYAYISNAAIQICTENRSLEIREYISDEQPHEKLVSFLHHDCLNIIVMKTIGDHDYVISNYTTMKVSVYSDSMYFCSKTQDLAIHNHTSLHPYQKQLGILPPNHCLQVNQTFGIDMNDYVVVHLPPLNNLGTILVPSSGVKYSFDVYSAPGYDIRDVGLAPVHPAPSVECVCAPSNLTIYDLLFGSLMGYLLEGECLKVATIHWNSFFSVYGIEHVVVHIPGTNHLGNIKLPHWGIYYLSSCSKVTLQTIATLPPTTPTTTTIPPSTATTTTTTTIPPSTETTPTATNYSAAGVRYVKDDLLSIPYSNKATSIISMNFLRLLLVLYCLDTTILFCSK